MHTVRATSLCVAVLVVMSSLPSLAAANGTPDQALDRAMDREAALAKSLHIRDREEAISQALAEARGRQIFPPPTSTGPRLAPPARTGAPLTPRAAAPTAGTAPPGSLAATPARLGTPAALQVPVTIHDGTPMIPLRDAAARLYYSLIDLGGGSFQLLAPSGETRMVTAPIIDGQAMVTREQLEDYFGVRASVDPSTGALYVQAPQPSAFRTAIVDKPIEDIQQEQAEQALARRAVAPVLQGPYNVPEAARPDVDLNLRETYTYLRPHQGDLFRSLISSVSGRAYDFDVNFEDVHKDINKAFDHDYTRLDLTRPGLFMGFFDQSTFLYPLRGQSDTFNGAKIIESFGGWHATTLAGGDTENTVSGGSGTVKYLGHLYEAREELFPVNWLRLRGGAIYTDNEADLPSQVGLTNYPRNNLITYGGGRLGLPWGISLLGDVAHADYNPDNNSDNSVRDWDYRGEAIIERPRYRAGVNYELVGDQYASLGDPATYRDFEGWNVYGDYRMTDRWTLSSSLLRYHNNVDDSPKVVEFNNQAFTLSSAHRLLNDQTMALTYNRFSSDPNGPDPGSSTVSDLYRVDYIVPVLPTARLLTSYQYYDSRATTASDTQSHTVSGSLFSAYGKGSSLVVSGLATKRFQETSPDTLDLSTTLNVDHRLRNNVNAFLNTTYTRTIVDKEQGIEPDNTLSGSTGLRMQLLRDTSAQVEYSVNSYDLDAAKRRSPKDWSILFLISQNFGIKTPPSYGRIEGRVFEDLNGNGRPDPGEPWVGDATVRLADQREALTDAQGRFSFFRVVPGKQEIELNASSLDPALTAVRPRRPITVKRHRTLSVDFPLIKTGSMSGHVFIDENSDGAFQDTEEPLEGIPVILQPGQPGEQFRRTTGDGEYQFEDLLPGRYTVQLHTEDIPAGYQLASPQAATADVAAGQEVKAVNFAVRLVAPVTQFGAPAPQP